MTKKHFIRITDQSHCDRVLAPGAAELFDRAGIEIAIEASGDEDTPRRVDAILDALETGPAVFLRLSQLSALGELAAGTAHEARNLLTAIIGFAQLGRESGHDVDNLARQLDRIEREAGACVTLLERFLSLSHPESPPSVAIEVAQVVELVAEAARPQLEIQRIVLDVRKAPDLPRVACSQVELTQVLLNLVINAMHATPEGGRISIALSSTGAGIELAVSDTGRGIDPELHERIFEPFYTTKPLGKGTGLGLAMCRRMVKAAGGTISVESAIGEGATFVIRLPSAGGDV